MSGVEVALALVPAGVTGLAYGLVLRLVWDLTAPVQHGRVSSPEVTR